MCLWSGCISPPIRTFVEKRFHGLFSKKKALKSGGFLSRGFVIKMRLRSISFAEQILSDEITWITWKTKQNLGMWSFWNQIQSLSFGKWFGIRSCDRRYIDLSSLFANSFPSSYHTIPVLAHLLFCRSSSNHLPHPAVLRRLLILIAHRASEVYLAKWSKSFDLSVPTKS